MTAAFSPRNVEALLQVVRDARSGAGYAERIEYVTSAIAEAVGAQTNSAFCMDLARPEAARVHFRGRDAGELTAYLTTYRPFDPMNRSILCGDERVILLSDFTTGRSWGRDPFTGEFLPRTNLRYIMGATAIMPDGQRLGLAFQREPSRRRDFSERDRAMFQFVMHDVTRAAFGALLREKVDRLAAGAGPAEDGAGAAVLDAHGDVVHADAPTLAVLRDLDGPSLEQLSDDAHALVATGREGATRERAFAVGEGRILATRSSTFVLEGATAVLTTTRLVTFQPARTPPRFEALSTREREVAALAAEGLSNRQIGARLSISPATVSVHMSRVFRKANLAGRNALVRWFHS